MMDMRREWELGMQLKAALEQPDGTLPGFTRTCDCMVVVKDEKRGSATFQGMFMERINGWPIHKRIFDPSFHNIHYIREMLFQVLSALDRAQRSLGFNHADLGLGNVMEHYPKLFPDLQQEELDTNSSIITEAAASGTSPRAPGSPLLPGRSASWHRTQAGSGCAMPPLIAGFSCDSDGKLTPLGPHIEFKIIDYGVGEFNEVLAQAAGGHEPEETLQRIQDVFAARGISMGSESKKALNLVDDGEVPIVSSEKKSVKKAWKLLPFGGNRFVVTNGIVDPTTMTTKKKKKEYQKKPGKSALQSMSSGRGPVERMYRHFWSRKGDVFHLMLALAVALDDRVWPKRDERDVQLFISLVHHVTGVKMKAYFTSSDDPKRPKVMGQRKKRDTSDESVYGARVRCFAALRRARMLYAAHVSPFNSGLLAGEALVAPFFGIKGAPHAELPVCVEAAFPFREV